MIFLRVARWVTKKCIVRAMIFVPALRRRLRLTLLGKQAASKPAAWGSNPHARASSIWIETITDSALRVWWMHDCLRSSRTGFDSSVGYLDNP